MNELLRRARGVLLGQAVGDALGTTVEFQSPEAIAARDEGDGWPARVVGKGPFEVAPGQVTDDTELALALARTLAQQGRYDADAVARAYVAWRRSGPWDCGQATHLAFGLGGPLPEALAEKVAARASRKTQANGALMRVSPLGVFGHTMEPRALATLAALDARLSHPDPLCQAASAVYTVTIAAALREGLDGPRAWDFALAFCAEEPLALPAKAVLEGCADVPPAFDDARQGWVKLALGYAFFHLRHARSFRDAVTAVVRAGGDTDTNAAITGALLGAVLGEDGVPADWRTTVLECRPERPREYHCGDLLDLAERLVERGRAQGN
ncbi:MAG: ADP-ribosylglycohydrolase family protein [Myxococcota bacterium]